MPLWPHQLKGLGDIERAFAHGAKGVFYSLPTAGGKTGIFSAFTNTAVACGKKVAILCHREELIKQTQNTLNQYSLISGIIQAGDSTAPIAPVQICSIDSMETRELPMSPDYLIIDEAHLVNADRYQSFLDRYPSARRLFFSATPIRTDGTGFEKDCDVLITGPGVNELIKGGYLVPSTMYTGSRVGAQLSRCQSFGKEYNLGYLDRVLNNNKFISEIITGYQTHAFGRKGVVFAVGINHSKAIAHAFNRAGIAAEHLDGTTSSTDRNNILERLSEGTTRIVCNVNVLSEGWDEPSISYIGLARPTQSTGLYIQQAGRGLRRADGKMDCIYVDHGGNIEAHGHIQDERAWTLSGSVATDFAHKHCPSCDAWIPRRSILCRCGHQFLAVVDDTLTSGQEDRIKVPPARPDDTHPIHRAYIKLLKYARANGYTPAWAYNMTRQKFGPEKTAEALNYEETNRYCRKHYEG